MYKLYKNQQYSIDLIATFSKQSLVLVTLLSGKDSFILVCVKEVPCTVENKL